MTRRPRDIGASVRARLLRLAREHQDDYQLVLTRYANERLLYRLSESDHADRFVLKGAALFVVWTGAPHRATRDIDLLGYGDPSHTSLASIFTEVLAMDVADDGVGFDAASLTIGPIRDDQSYGGIRVLVVSRIGTARVRLQVDVGFGDAITPEATTVEFPTLLDSPAPRLRAYPRETVVSEKLEAIVQLGMANSRMKDLYDLYVLSRSFEFEGSSLVRAIRATFERRGTPLPSSLPVALSQEFTTDASKQIQWAAFVRKSRTGEVAALGPVVDAIRTFLEEPLLAARSGSTFARRWAPPGIWS